MKCFPYIITVLVLETECMDKDDGVLFLELYLAICPDFNIQYDDVLKSREQFREVTVRSTRKESYDFYEESIL